MKVLGKILVDEFDKFWQLFNSELDLPLEYLEEGHSLIFGDQGVDNFPNHQPPWTFLPKQDLSYHVAHELTHILLRRRQYPSTFQGVQHKHNLGLTRVANDIEEAVIHRALDALISPFGFTKNNIQERILTGAIKGLTNSPIPDNNTLWFYTWALRFAELKFELPAEKWDQLEHIYQYRCQNIASLGRLIFEIIKETGWDTRNDVLKSMISVRDILDLKSDDEILVMDSRNGIPL